ncbi:MAG: alpha/beta hydrolase [Chlorobiaceae bacterium]|nr:alpha/beta hydrolase [Chlorobiaceae bacterium]
MRMIFVHGINQQGKSSQQIREEWLSSLHTTFARQGSDPFGRLSRIDAAFYGNTLEQLSSVKVKDEAIALGAEEAQDDFDEFAVDALKEMALRIGATERQIDDEISETTVAQGAGPHKKWIKAIARVIEIVAPEQGAFALRLLGQAHAYIRNKSVHDEVNKLVRPLFENDEPAIVVSHSLGTIVAYSILREFAGNGRPRKSPLFVTLGSPLGIKSIRNGFPKPRIKPENVLRWVNGADPEDFVALRAELTNDNFGPGIENYPDIENGKEDPHSITAYLRDPRIVKAIAESIP